MKQTDKLILFYKLIKNQADQEEVSLADKLLSESSENKDIYGEIEQMISATEKITKTIPKFDKDQLKHKIFAEIKTDEIPESTNGKIIFMYLRRAAYVAASLLLVFFAVNLYSNWQARSIKLAFNGKREISNLPDQTSIILDKNAEIAYGKYFNKDKREVYLDGTAYFNVSKNKEKPFIIHIDNLTVKVLGTSFVIAKHQNRVDISVYTGIVNLTSENGQSINLLKSQSASFNTDSEVLTKTNSNVSENNDLRAEFMNFQSDDVKDVLKRIEDFYNITIRIECDNISEMKGFTSPQYTGNDVQFYFSTLNKLYNLQFTLVAPDKFVVRCN